MAEQIACTKLAMGKALFDGGQAWGIGFEHFLGEYMTLDLHLAQHGTQHAGKVGDPWGQRQINQLDVWWHRQTGVADDQDVAMPQRGNDP
ncbi:hypothetical protein D3C76_1450910 [compost metagenome]